MGLFEVLNIWMIRQRNFGAVAKAALARAATQILAQLAIALFVEGPAGLLFGLVLGYASATLLLAGDFGLTRRESWTPVKTKRLAWAARRFVKFPYYWVPNDLLNALVVHLPEVLIAAIYGPIQAGLFLLAHRMLGLPIMLIGRSTGQVFLGEMSHCLRNHPERAPRLFMRTSLRLFAIGCTLVVPFALLGPRSFGIVFGDEWANAAHYFQYLSIMFLWRFSAAPNTYVFTLLERHGTALALNLSRALIVATIFAWAAFWRVDVYDCMKVFCVAMSLGYFAQIAACYYILKRPPHAALR
jgi:O-antigen/teichoic acid export membrane protein